MLGAAFLRVVPRIIDLLCMKESRTQGGSIFFQTLTIIANRYITRVSALEIACVDLQSRNLEFSHRSMP